MLETLLAKHCGPALAGIKPGNLVTCIKNEIPNLKSDILRLNSELNRKDIYIEPAAHVKISYRTFFPFLRH